jgi:hypothetical protein
MESAAVFGCDAVDSGRNSPTFQRNVLCSSTGSKSRTISEQVLEIFLGVKSSRNIRLTNSPPSVNHYLQNVGTSASQTPMGIDGLLQG